jgi:hypothetical protein
MKTDPIHRTHEPRACGKMRLKISNFEQVHSGG